MLSKLCSFESENEYRHLHRIVGGRTTSGVVGVERLPTGPGVLGQKDDRSGESTKPKVRPGGAEKGLGGIATLGVSLGLKVLRRGGERRLLSWAVMGEEGGDDEPSSTISTVTIGVVVMSGRGGSDRRLKVKRKPVVSLDSGR